MSLFRDLGRRAEKLKKQATDAAESQAEYGCADCGRTLFTERESCPDCGSEAVVRRNDPTETDGSADADDADESTDAGDAARSTDTADNDA